MYIAQKERKEAEFSPAKLGVLAAASFCKETPDWPRGDKLFFSTPLLIQSLFPTSLAVQERNLLQFN